GGGVLLAPPAARPPPPPPPPLPDLNHHPAPYPPLDDAPADLHDPGQIDLAGHSSEFARVEIGPQSPPGLPPPLQRTHHGIHADERYATQDERRDRRWKIHPTGQSAGGDRAAIAGHRQHVGQRGRPNGIDGAGPALSAERFGRADELLAFHDL